MFVNRKLSKRMGRSKRMLLNKGMSREMKLKLSRILRGFSKRSIKVS